MAVKTVKACDICDRYGTDVEVAQYEVQREQDVSRYAVLLCRDHRGPLENFLAHSTPIEKQKRRVRRTFQDSIVQDPDLIPRVSS